MQEAEPPSDSDKQWNKNGFKLMIKDQLQSSC